jgi:hypothetical protein
MQGVPLVVIQQSKSIPKREIGQTAVNIAEAKGQLIGVGQINLGSIANAGRTQRELPSVDPPLARTKILHAPVPTIPASGFVSNELQFGSLFAPVWIELYKALKVET